MAVFLFLGDVMKRKNIVFLILLIFTVTFMAAVCLFIGSSNLKFTASVLALFGKGEKSAVLIVRGIRLPRVLAAIICGAGLSVSGLIMQTVLNNPMASPSTLGVSNAAVFGANLSIIALSGGFVSAGKNITALTDKINPFAAGSMAFIFAMLSVFLILGLCKIRRFSPNVVVLSGIAIGSVFSAATTLLQFYATDTGLSAAVIWTFGDLGRATYKTDVIMLAVSVLAIVIFFAFSWQYNSLLSGEESATALGVNVKLLRFVSMLLASLITAVCVSYLGIIGFVGIICPHIEKRFLGQNHRISIPVSALLGSLLLLCADALSRSLGSGSAIPVGAVTALLGAPFFIAILLTGKGKHNA